MTIEEVHQLIRTRRSVYPPQYIEQEIPKAVLQKALENANCAPTHKLTQPWRFRVMQGTAQKRFGIFMSEKYRSITSLETFSIAKYEKLKMNPQKAGALIAICMQRDPKGRVPEWEEVAAVAMAVQNIWLTLHAYGVGSYWSTPDLLEYFGEFEPLEEGEQCLGIFYAGYYNELPRGPKKEVAQSRVKWLD
ncbi:nitroreductase [Marinoscillum sp. MHG1-6]|uniref:nitroreductase family protein n=1 Tax=Marinoscillum sp. MHG1-6 TaxID=2959627 RepID=UPI002157C9E9|nr:nitroreductase [Marinoscillum sp. MHG1-6]